MAALAVWAFALALPAIGARATYGARVTADEPQYLTTAISIGEDFDLDISDELDERRFEPYHETDLNPQTIELDDSGRRVSPHDPLLPALLALPMRLGGWVAAKAALAAFAAAAAAATLWLAVRRFGVGVGVGGLVVGAFYAAPPLTSYATQVYPEMPAALCLTLGLAAVTGPLERTGRVLAAASIVALPWLSVKFVPVAAVLAVVLAAGLWPDRRRQMALDLERAQADCDRVAVQRCVSRSCSLRSRAARATASLAASRPLQAIRALPLGLSAVLAVAGAAYVVFHRSVYGGWTAYAAGDHFIDGELLVLGSDPDYLGRSRRLIGLLVDSGFGLAAWAPAYLLVVPALAALARRRPPGWSGLLAVFAAGYAVATWAALTMHGWWWPGRQVVVVLPTAVVAVAVLADRLAAPRWMALAGCLVGIFNWVWLVVEASTGRRTLIVDFEQTANPVYQAWSALLPDHRRFDGGAVALTVVWTAVLVAVGVWGWLRSRPEPPGSSRAARSAAAVPGESRQPIAADATPPARSDPDAAT